MGAAGDPRSLTFEVFRQERKGQPFQHAGSLDAPDAAFAEAFAREQFGRRGESVALWLVPREAIREVDEWADEFAAKLAAAPDRTDAGLAVEAAAALRGLARSADREVVLCTDLHAGNVLAAEREPWLVIDPKAHVGDPAYDALQHMLNCPGRLVANPLGLTRPMADLLDLDAERVGRWLFARCVLESAGQPWLAGVAASLA